MLSGTLGTGGIGGLGVFSTGSPSVLEQGEDGRHYVVPSGLFPNLPCNSPPRTGSHRFPGEKFHISPPPVPRSPPFPNGESHRGSLTCFPITFVFFHFAHWYYIYCRIVSFVFLVFSLSLAFLRPSPVCINRPEDRNSTEWLSWMLGL